MTKEALPPTADLRPGLVAGELGRPVDRLPGIRSAPALFLGVTLVVSVVISDAWTKLGSHYLVQTGERVYFGGFGS